MTIRGSEEIISHNKYIVYICLIILSEVFFLNIIIFPSFLGERRCNRGLSPGGRFPPTFIHQVVVR